MDRSQKILAVAIVFILTILTSGYLFGCSCDQVITVRESVKYSDIVFKGQVISKTISSDLSPYGVTIKGDTTSFAFKWTKNPVAIFKIKVNKIYKGKNQADTVSIITSVNETSCGFRFQLGQNYIVYGTKRDQTLMVNTLKRVATNDGVYWTNLCTRTTLYFQKEEDEIQSKKK